MLLNETVTIGGKLDPGIPDATVLVTFSDPNQTTMTDVPTTTDSMGYFEVSYTPDVAGNWTWMAWWNGADLVSHSYSYAYGDLNVLQVMGLEAQNGEEPPPEGIPIEYIYAIVAGIAIVVILAVAYLYLKRRK